MDNLCLKFRRVDEALSGGKPAAGTGGNIL